MTRVYLTTSDEQGEFSYPAYLRDRRILRATTLSAMGNNDEVARFGGYRTRTIFTHRAASWDIDFAMVPTTPFSSVAGKDDDVLDFYRAQGVYVIRCSQRRWMISRISCSLTYSIGRVVRKSR